MTSRGHTGAVLMSESSLRDISVAASAGPAIRSTPLFPSQPAVVSPAHFARDGFLSIPALTTEADTEQIRALLDPLFARFDTLGERAVDLAGPRAPGQPLRSPEINEALILEPRLKNTLTYLRCREVARQLLGVPVGYQFDHAIFKAPQNRTPTAWHQDEAYSQEPIPLRSVHFWIPLQSVTQSNGCMWFIPGSHRGPLLPHRLLNSRTDGSNKAVSGGTLVTDNVDDSQAVACPLAIGGVTVHHPLTLHYTGANQSDSVRKAWIIHFGAYGWFRRRLHPKVLMSRLARSLP